MSIRIGINAGFGDPISNEFDNLKRLRFTDVRQDMQYVLSPARWNFLRDEFVESGMTPLYIINPEQVTYLRPGDRAELINEPNFSMTAAQYAETWNRISDVIMDNQLTMFFGSISNLNKVGITWLREAWNLALTKPTHVSIHRYPRDGGVYQPHRGFQSRFDEVDAVRQIVGSTTTLSVTEFGYHTARRWRWGFFPTRWNDTDVARMLRVEWGIWETMRIESAYVYQLNDGMSRSYHDKFGIRYINGQWKPSATAHI